MPRRAVACAVLLALPLVQNARAQGAGAPTAAPTAAPAPTTAPAPAAAPTPTTAPTPPPAPEVVDATTARARAHFKKGIKLYRDGNYAGALAEFEAAYGLKPGPGSLQNIALCQKALFRYSEAADSLTRLLLRHDSELSEAERSAARVARDELKGLVGSIRLLVTPADARVTLDGESVSPAARAASLRVNVGEHVIVAEASGYARLTRTIRVAGGQDVPVTLTLEAVLGFLDVRASDPGAAIAVDGKALSLGRYVGPVTPVEDHLVQVYKAGFEPFETRVRVEVGQTLVVNGKLGKAEKDAAPAPPGAPGALPPPPPPKPSVGWFGVVSLNLQTTGVAPFGLSVDKARSLAGGLGGRGGYRLRANVAVEGLVELGTLSVKDACDPSGPDPICGLDYLVRWGRLGPAVRIMSSADRLRVSGGIGAGIVWHQLKLSPGRNPGVDPFLLMEIGVAANWRRFLFGLDLFLLLDGTRGMNAQRLNAAGEWVEAFPNGRTLSFVGIGVRTGMSEWGSPF